MSRPSPPGTTAAAAPGPGADELDTLGYLVDGIWFAGDTDYDPAMEALRGRVDVALIPIWGWGPSLGPGHLDPAGAARVIDLIAPRIAMPIHWGTFLPLGLGRRHERLLTDPPLRVRAPPSPAPPRSHRSSRPGGVVEL